MDSINSLQPMNLENAPVKKTSLNQAPPLEVNQPNQESATNALQRLNQAEKVSPKEEFVNNPNEITESDVDDVVEGLNEKLQTLQSYLMFEKDEDTEKMVFFIKNTETDEILRQVPSQELLAISKNITDYLEMVNQASSKSLPPVGILANEVV